MTLHNLIKLLEYKVLLDQEDMYLVILYRILQEGWITPAQQIPAYGFTETHES